MTVKWWILRVLCIGLATQYSECTEQLGDTSTQAIQELYKKVEVMQREVVNLQEENHKMQSQMIELKEENHKLKNQIDEENHKMQSHIDDLNEEIHQMQSHIDDLSMDNYQLNTEVRELKAKVTDLEMENGDIEDSINSLKGEPQKPRSNIMPTTLHRGERGFTKAQKNDFVAFTAFAVLPRSYFAAQRVVFDGVVTNYGNHYNAVDSIFTCPVSGLYLFMVHYKTETPAMWASIQLDGVDLVTTFGYADLDQGSNSVFTQCEPGQIVDVVCQFTGSYMTGNGASNGRWSTFSGVMLQITA